MVFEEVACRLLMEVRGIKIKEVIRSRRVNKLITLEHRYQQIDSRN